MSLLDKIMFWKHEEPIIEKSYGPDNLSPLDDEKEFKFDEDMNMEHIGPNAREKPPIQTLAASSQMGSMNRDVELILAKLDAIKARVESMDARLANLEELAKE